MLNYIILYYIYIYVHSGKIAKYDNIQLWPLLRFSYSNILYYSWCQDGAKKKSPISPTTSTGPGSATPMTLAWWPGVQNPFEMAVIP